MMIRVGFLAVGVLCTPAVFGDLAEHSAIYRITYSGEGLKKLLVDCQWGMVDKGKLSTRIRECDVTQDGKTGVFGSRSAENDSESGSQTGFSFDNGCRAV